MIKAPPRMNDAIEQRHRQPVGTETDPNRIIKYIRIVIRRKMADPMIMDKAGGSGV